MEHHAVPRPLRPHTPPTLVSDAAPRHRMTLGGTPEPKPLAHYYRAGRPVGRVRAGQDTLRESPLISPRLPRQRDSPPTPQSSREGGVGRGTSLPSKFVHFAGEKDCKDSAGVRYRGASSH